MISLFRLPGGKTWHYRFSVKGQRRQRSTGETSKTRAEAIAQDAFHAARLRALGMEPEPTLADLVDKWVRAHALCLSPNHLQNVERFGIRHFEPLHDLRLSALTTQVVEDARAQFLAEHARSSANQWLATLRLLLHWAIRRRMIAAMPFDLKMLKIKRKPKALLPMSHAAEWLAEVEALSEREPAIALAVRLMLGLGLRGGEARHARWEWLDWDRKVYTPGATKGGEAWARPVPDWLLDQLQPMAQPSGWLLGKPVSRERIQRVMDAACKAVGVPRLTPHRLRGTYATWLSALRVPIQDIARALAHKDVRTTMAYLEVDLERVAGAQKRMTEKLHSDGRESGERPMPWSQSGGSRL